MGAHRFLYAIPQSAGCAGGDKGGAFQVCEVVAAYLTWWVDPYEDGLSTGQVAGRRVVRVRERGRGEEEGHARCVVSRGNPSRYVHELGTEDTCMCKLGFLDQRNPFELRSQNRGFS